MAPFTLHSFFRFIFHLSCNELRVVYEVPSLFFFFALTTCEVD